MEQKTLAADTRSERKKGASRRLRRAGKIPAVIYGYSGTAAITVDEREFQSKFKTISENTIINLNIADKSYDVLVKDYQEDILTGKLLHIDFYEVEAGKTLRTHIPVRLTGTPVGVKEGGVLEQLMHDIEVECLPKDIPESISLDVSGLDIGMSIHVSDLPEMPDVKVLSSPEYGVVSVTTMKIEIPEPGEEGLEEEGEAALVGEEEEGEEEAAEAEGGEEES